MADRLEWQQLQRAMPEYLSIKDAARRLGVKPKEIRRRIKDGELEGFVRLPGGAFGGPEDAGDFGPAAPNRRAAPPPEREVHVQRLEETVMVLQGELNARRQEVEELHVLLREIRDGLAAQGASTTDTQSVPADVTAPTPEAAAAAPAEPEIDWGAYDAESEQLRATMGRLEALLEQLEAPDPAAEPELEPEPQAAPTAAAAEPVPVAPPASEPSASASTSPAAPPQPDGARQAASTVTAVAEGEDAPTGEALGRRREKLGVSREALAAFSRISWGFITEVESGRRKDPRSRQRLAAALDAWQKRLADERRKAATSA